jgi:methylenetetrahydrofolate--tRNA-(uracil-5-)-methyltransferase
MSKQHIKIIGGGLSGCEAAWQAVQLGCPVRLYEMKPKKFSPAHHSSSLAELVCSNSLRSNATTSAVGLLKEEMRQLDSLLIKIADETAVPAGQALAVDREKFAAKVTDVIHNHPLIEVIHEEQITLTTEADTPLILATGPLTSEEMAESLSQLTGRERLAFYDAIAPIVSEDSLNMNIIYSKSRWEDGPGDYLNCPMDKEQYLAFIQALGEADTVPLKEFEDAKYFEGCLPIEVMRARGEDTLRYGPMKPVGLRNPRTGHDPYAAVQLRKENKEGTTYNMVGFQTKLTYPEQKRIFRMIPGMEEVDFIRLGSIHRNTFVCAPELLETSLQLKGNPQIYLAGQLSGVEGYVESTAMGLLAGLNAARTILGKEIIPPPPETAHGALICHLTQTEPGNFQPSNVNFGLFPAWKKKVPKKLRGEKRKEIALAALALWRQQLGYGQMNTHSP